MSLERVVVSDPVVGLCYMQVCAVHDATDAEILAVCNRENPSGTSCGWSAVCRSTAPEDWRRRGPVACAEHPDRQHFLVAC
jgi:hypothetical protein